MRNSVSKEGRGFGGEDYSAARRKGRGEAGYEAVDVEEGHYHWRAVGGA